jgi:hypothetical protein
VSKDFQQVKASQASSSAGDSLSKIFCCGQAIKIVNGEISGGFLYF